MAKINSINTPAKRKKLDVKREPHWFTFAKGRALGFRKTTTGGTWVVKHGRKQTGLGQEVDLTYDEAHTAAMKATSETGITSDPKMIYTLDEVLERYRIKRATETTEKKALTEQKRMHKKLPIAMRNTLAVEISEETFSDWKISRVRVIKDADEAVSPEGIDSVRASKMTFNRDWATIKAALNHTYGQSFIGGWSNVNKFPDVDSSRRLFLKTEEVARWMQAATGPIYDLCYAGLLTGCRIGELRHLKVWQFEENPSSDGHYILDIKQSKTGPRIQRLSLESSAFLKAVCQGRDKDEPMFPNPEGKMWTGADYLKPVNDLKLEADLPDETIFYSLRHYYISKSLIAGFNVIALARNVGTSVLMIEKHYAKFMATDVHNMLDAVKL